MKETMTIRKALAEKKLLDKKITKLFSTFNPTFISRPKEEYVGAFKVDELAEKIKADYQALNDLIKRREAINKAIFDSNAVAKITVPKFINLVIDNDATSKAATEEISIAVAINRKEYYKQLYTYLTKIKTEIAQTADVFRMTNIKNQQAAQAALEIRYKDKQNVPKDWSALLDAEIKNNAPEFNDPLDFKHKIDILIESIETYLSNIDVKLSSATEVNEITINY